MMEDIDSHGISCPFPRFAFMLWDTSKNIIPRAQLLPEVTWAPAELWCPLCRSPLSVHAIARESPLSGDSIWYALLSFSASFGRTGEAGIL